MKITTHKFQNITVAIIFGWLIFFVLVPNILVLGTSFLTRDTSNLIDFTFSLDSYKRLFDPLYAQVMWNSLYMSGLATIICLLIGYPFAFMIAKLPSKYRPILLFMVILPFWTNSLIRIYGMKIFLGVRGVLNNTLMSLGIIDSPIRIINTEIAVIIGLVYILLPFMILPLYSAIEKLDGRLLEAAKDLGAGTVQRFVRIILPLTMPGIIAGCLLVLLPAMGMFYVADLLGGAKVLLVGNVIKSEFLVSRNWPFGSAISIGLTILMALLLYIYYRAGKLLNKKPELE
ncbi:spermidine/putrescine ABC transporter permease PotB [Testudinibacter sp. TR-2022]|uniref:spermidine/putrescine ABC transporter permease PotB n=1 Tax=Testudinibacter sp. TR-2022 TaxID=2585029 RepID=UPI00111A851C|nr:spermidine/putrescine ABC transporter permease PotB [Testudinibacter sp. TR-2022]TNG96316.1 spermidine/putrescine ABC transporter permease PotB [Pasteurellaceae bacterium USgator41]TNG97178.1 spermidine/putrescine ABC transporter permease PotB [Pasteurellaceae bacterium UScroc12]TNH00388.1 spermidine/putrescine ABC transporter permease PotB [Pasteurellaceae bacterium UScroc31]TNH03109.1 spermidine/putrescine ABC transporter permease PotB [Pasteurellaceae bacterium USgator11]TNH08570.1 sperm